MSKNGHKDKLSPAQVNACQYQRNKAIAAWKAGRWDVYKKHIRIADGITRKG